MLDGLGHENIEQFDLTPIALREAIIKKLRKPSIIPYKLIHISSNEEQHFKAYLSNGAMICVITQLDDVEPLFEHEMTISNIREIQELNLLNK
ncbi:hypothetical protein BAMA_15660 [Bacillus manliponensis]|uniref:Uncharacterized protein n=1 Tax=Bacillus manliponensis TaxID=574376 RepID=A0A073JQG3_9BACI|nr:hypothetical protein [Bacillus manliponensis]KEK17324.1 hypothetical protein BAMA_15660 [Bacillus manliponensis]